MLTAPSLELPQDDRPIWERIAELAEQLPQEMVSQLPTDGASRLDHYLYGPYDTLKAISVRQPWANLIRTGYKTIETRTWPTQYRGDLVIVSSRRPRIEPAGMALAIVRLVDCRPMTSADEAAARCRCYERAWAWVLSDVRPIEPIPVRGQLGLYTISGDTPFRPVQDKDWPLVPVRWYGHLIEEV